MVPPLTLEEALATGHHAEGFTMTLSSEDEKLLKAILEPFENQRKLKDKGHLGGYCIPVSINAQRVLNNRNFMNRVWTAVEGEYLGETNQPRGHTWLIGGKDIPDIMLDLTADQYKLKNPYCDTWPNSSYCPNPMVVDVFVHEITTSWNNVVDESLSMNGF